ncbi:MAG: type II toxin-antitoxin system RelE/ParE family toxin [Verrucomicrobia bacterium]|jgi:plasmid stabilization system protein ParE|nr:type II toxin-antitoxin system RelE/ParE family toxin [Verrucomicrobiota bacterium]|tara:strand:+ start:49253 stop:49546 length:294 start_codon:yes stop_codon:yes gene_type:complete
MTVVWSEQSRSELRAIDDFIARDSELYAGRQVQRVIAKDEQTSLMPTCGHPVHEYPKSGFREVHEGGYRIIYRFSSEEMDVATIAHMKQDFPKARLS